MSRSSLTALGVLITFSSQTPEIAGRRENRMLPHPLAEPRRARIFHPLTLFWKRHAQFLEV